LLRDSDAESSRSTTARAAGSARYHVGRLTLGQGATLIGKPGNVCRHDRYPFRLFRPAQQTRVDHGLHHDRERGLQAEHAERRLGECVFLVMSGMWCVVGRHRVDGPVRQRFP
jgi:hypothetical protein